MAKNELVDHMKSFPDADSRAHFALESGLAFTNAPELRELIEMAAMGDGPHSRLLAASLPRQEKKKARLVNSRRNRAVSPRGTEGAK